MKPTKPYIRRAHHAGSWYENNTTELSSSLEAYLHDAEQNIGSTSASTITSNSNSRNLESPYDNSNSNSDSAGIHLNTSTGIPRGVISPHAGFSYSGPTAAYAYHALKEALERGWSGTVLVLHPSHHVYLNGCAVSGASTIETPIRHMPVDESLRSELLATKHFTVMKRSTDEMEHSGEMQYPYIAKIYSDFLQTIQSSSIATATSTAPPPPQLHILPIMVGATSTAQEKHFGQILAPYLSRSNIFTVISSDFCHWGHRFGYDPTHPPDHIQLVIKKKTEIHEYIEWLDRLGMDKISMQEPGAFATYLKTFKNTICGRHPIGIYLNALKENKEQGAEELTLTFVRYAQSSRVKSLSESSVSYASAIARGLH